MSLETDLQALLLTKCPRTFPLTAPYGTQVPYVTWQHVGGDPIRFLDKTAPSTRNAFIQINTWAATPAQAFALAREIEDALIASTVLQCESQGEPLDAHDDGDALKGAVQSFSIWGNRS